MTRPLIILVLLCCSFQLKAQDVSEEQKIKKVVTTFFEGFHARDSIIMKSSFHEDPVIQTVGVTKDGEVELVREELQKVLKGIVSIPLKTDFKEVLHDYQIQIDGNMAHVWTPYSFFLNDTFSHCGVNSFQLIREAEEWKIIYLIDTRRKEECDKTKLN